MNEEDLSDLIGKAPVEAETPAPEPQADPPSPEASEDGAPESPPRGAGGKFARKEPPLTEKETVGFYKAMQEERDKRQALEKQLAELKAKAEPAPDLSRDQQVEQRIHALTLTTSRKLAEKEHGKDLLAKVHDWAVAKCDADPAFNQTMFATDDPYEHAVEAYNREQVLAKVKPDELDEFEAWKAAKAAPQPNPEPSAPETPVPRSLANAPGNGAAGKAHVPTGPGLAFGSIIK